MIEKQIVIRVSPDLHEKVKYLAKTEDRSVNKTIIRLLVQATKLETDTNRQ